MTNRFAESLALMKPIDILDPSLVTFHPHESEVNGAWPCCEVLELETARESSTCGGEARLETLSLKRGSLRWFFSTRISIQPG